MAGNTRRWSARLSAERRHARLWQSGESPKLAGFSASGGGKARAPGTEGEKGGTTPFRGDMRKTMTRCVYAMIAALCLVPLLHAAPASPIAAAAERADKDAVRALLKQAADVNGSQGDGMTALHWAATHGDAELAAMLVYAGANMRATTRLGGYTALHLAS